MQLPRDLTLLAHFLFDSFIPPILRDSKWFMWLPFKILFGKKAQIFFEFKAMALNLSHQEFIQLYQQASGAFIARETDLNRACIEAIESEIVGNTVLDIACGRGFLAKRLAKRHHVTAADLLLDPQLIADCPHIRFQQAQLECLPFSDAEFDTVVCAHTLEHVQDLHQAILELRRVTAKRLIIVAPKQRPYKYTFDLHLHFFPYAWSLLTILRPFSRKHYLKEIHRDWFYLEDRAAN